MPPSEPLAIDRRAPTERIEFDATSWIEVTRGIVVDPRALFAEAMSWEWREETHFRYEVTVSRERRIGRLPHPVPAAIRQLELHLEARHRVRFVGPAALLYPHGGVTMGYHRDREMRWLDDTLVAIVSLGDTRRLGFRPYAADRDDPGIDRSVELRSGDLLVMGGRFQSDWLHGVPAVAGAGPRVSLTWRWAARTGRPDSSEGYNAPRRFGSSGRVGPQPRRR